MFKESYRVLRKNGVILIYSHSKLKKEKLAKTHINLNTPSSLKRHLESVGFKLSKHIPSKKDTFWKKNLFKTTSSILNI